MATSARVRVSRRIAADPASTALLLASPAALELWPGVRRVDAGGGPALVETPLGTATVTAHPPRRTPTAFSASFTWSGQELAAGTGVLTLSYAPGGDGTPTTTAELVVDVEGVERSRLDAGSLTAMAQGFLHSLARAARERRAAA